MHVSSLRRWLRKHEIDHMFSAAQSVDWHESSDFVELSRVLEDLVDALDQRRVVHRADLEKGVDGFLGVQEHFTIRPLIEDAGRLVWSDFGTRDDRVVLGTHHSFK